jgi:hypothetical protein
MVVSSIAFFQSFGFLEGSKDNPYIPIKPFTYTEELLPRQLVTKVKPDIN